MSETPAEQEKESGVDMRAQALGRLMEPRGPYGSPGDATADNLTAAQVNALLYVGDQVKALVEALQPATRIEMQCQHDPICRAITEATR